MVGYTKTSAPSKRVAMKILSAYGQGVTSISEGVEYTALGRDLEVSRFEQVLKMTKEASGMMQGYVGPYGVGKSFILAMFQHFAIKKDFVVMSADVTRSSWFAGTSTEKQGLYLYRELIKNTAIKGKSRNAFDAILQKWYADLKESTGGDIHDICSEFNRLTRDCNDLPKYDDIRNVICTRFREIHFDNDRSESMNFFQANITRKPDANLLGARDYIHESEWFDIMNTWAHLFVKAGYKGLIILVDQVDYLTNLSKQSRQQNYEFLLSMWNAVNEGRTEYLSVCLFAADKLIYDEHKGTPMYPALDDRFKGCTKLSRLSTDHLVALMIRLKEIHEVAYTWESNIDDQYAIRFVNYMLKNANISGNCIRPISMAWINLLNDRQVGKENDISNYLGLVNESASVVDEPADIPEEFPDD